MKLNYEQARLIAALGAGSVKEAMELIAKAAPYADDDIRRLGRETAGVLRTMTDAEFAAEILPQEEGPGRALSLEELKEYLEHIPAHTVVTVIPEGGV